ncbi:unnamed protein product [Wuchereria bancrofti]|uniref:Uncharacterized protein n=1 Tax=Wuchereria bancrofti TaxID=6293 RepID=A0A3P7EUD7_WUCBA|nr:unnamed protein product [Wuchereria bancrofti]
MLTSATTNNAGATIALAPLLLSKPKLIKGLQKLHRTFKMQKKSKRGFGLLLLMKRHAHMRQRLLVIRMGCLSEWLDECRIL